MESKNSILDGGKTPVSTVMRLAWPTIIEQIMLSMVTYVDTAMVGSLGSSATAAIGVTTSTIWLLNGVLNAAAVGFSVQLAHSMGAKRYEDARNVVRQSVLCNLVMGLIVGAAAFTLSFFIPTWMGADASIVPNASAYFRIISYSMPCLLTMNLFSAIFRCSGDMRTPMFLNIMLNIVNACLNFLFIFPTRSWNGIVIPGFGMGVKGAAIASTAATVIMAAVALVLVFKRDTEIKIMLRDCFRPDKAVLKGALKLGLPTLFERASISFGQMVMTRLVAGLGTVAIAANHLAVTAESISYMPAYGFAMAATTLVGQAVGANRPKDAMKLGKTTIFMGAGAMACTALLLFFIPEYLISLFNREAAVIALGALVLRIVAFAEPFFGISIVAGGALRGGGDTKWPFYISLACMWGVRVTVALIAVPIIGLAGVWLGMAVDLMCRGALSWWRFSSGKWTKNSGSRAN